MNKYVNNLLMRNNQNNNEDDKLSKLDKLKDELSELLKLKNKTYLYELNLNDTDIFNCVSFIVEKKYSIIKQRNKYFLCLDSKPDILKIKSFFTNDLKTNLGFYIYLSLFVLIIVKFVKILFTGTNINWYFFIPTVVSYLYYIVQNLRLKSINIKYNNNIYIVKEGF